jgi:hypothetical protein
MLRPLPLQLVQAEVDYRREQSIASAHRPERGRRSRRAAKRHSADRTSHVRSWPALLADLHRRPAATPPC